ncbi:MAG: metallophosphoesterase, partial [Thermoanaerobaculia bacterium]|nr:metallophosphoesterase [Thermoanaerobaculia bacterium]
MNPRLKKKLKAFLLVTPGLLVVGSLWWFGNATVVLTSGGVYDALLLPIGSDGQAIRWRANFSVVADNPDLESLQGPVIWFTSDGYRASWVCGSEVLETVVPSPSETLDIECKGRAHRFALHNAAPNPANESTSSPNHETDGEAVPQPSSGHPPLVEPATKPEPTPQRIAVTSDLEGNVAFFESWAADLGILGADGRWAYGDGQIAILGDVVDRGRHVFDLLWRLYHLEAEAKRAGGRVHLLLGNHEQYAFQARIKSVETEHRWAIEQIVPYAEAFAPDTVLGRWLRSKPIILKIDRTLFLHGGSSPRVLDSGLTIEEVNALHQKSLIPGQVTGEEYELLHGPHSPTQYRGYVRGGDHYPEADLEFIRRTRETFDVDQIVVGHSKVDELGRVNTSEPDSSMLGAW